MVKKYNIFIFWQTWPPPEDTWNRSTGVPPLSHQRGWEKTRRTSIITGFKVKMGSNNYTILNALRKIEGVDMAQRCCRASSWGGAAAPHPSSGSDTAARRYSKQHPQQKQCFPPGIWWVWRLLWDDQPQGRQRRPQGRPMGKADKVPIWKGASAEHWQEFKISLQAWHCDDWEVWVVNGSQILSAVHDCIGRTIVKHRVEPAGIYPRHSYRAER